MIAKTTRKPLFERLKRGLEEIAFARGELSLKTAETPDEPPEVDAATLVAIRKRTQMSQAVFAKVLNVSPKTVQSWEQGTRSPSHTSLRLIELFRQRPEIVCDLASLTSTGMPGSDQPLAKTVRVRGRRKLVAKST